MDERVASVLGFVFALFVVLAVVNKHVFEEIAADLTGTIRPHGGDAPSAPRRSARDGLGGAPIARHTGTGGLPQAAAGGTDTGDLGGWSEQVVELSNGTLSAPLAPDPQQRPEAALALLACVSGQAPRLWLCGLSPDAEDIVVTPMLGDQLAERWSDRHSRPLSVGLASHGCSREQVLAIRRVITDLCSGRLVGLSVFDLATGEPLPSCGL